MRATYAAKDLSVISRKLIAGLGVIFSVICLLGAPVLGQVKYSPDDEYVERLARAGVAWLEAGGASGSSIGAAGGSGGVGGGPGALMALTICEVSKRYDRLIPSDHPIVEGALASIVNSVENGSMDTTNSIYFPCLACIVMCDVNDQKYESQIKKILRLLEGWQQPNGSFNYPYKSKDDATIGDISQTQYACLAWFVAKHHGFRVDPEMVKRTLDWLCDAQVQNSWYYHTRNGRPASRIRSEIAFTLSRHCCGAGSVYLCSDLLRLNPKTKKNANGKATGRGDLPPSVSIYVKPKENMSEEERKTGPLVSFDGGKLASTKRQANVWFGDNFNVEIRDWNYYYLYALERYAFFRETAEGEVDEVPNWYDQGVEFLAGRQNDDGSWVSTGNTLESPTVSTCLAILFLVRSSEVLILPSNGSDLLGGIGFQENTKLNAKNGVISSSAAIKGIDDVMNLLDQDATDEQLQVLSDAMDETVRQFSTGDKSRGEINAFLTGLVKDRNYFRRLIAVKILSREQSMDHVPALLYALGDPDVRVAKEAHDGLRLISRKIDSYEIPSKPTVEDFLVVKKQWTKWFLQIRPNAELLD